MDSPFLNTFVKYRLYLTLTGNKPRNVFHIRVAWEDQVIDTLYNRSSPA